MEEKLVKPPLLPPQKIVVVGVDCSTTGYCAVFLDEHGDCVNTHSFKAHSDNDVCNMGQVADDFQDNVLETEICETKTVVVVTEAPIYIQNIKVTLGIARIVSGIQLMGSCHNHFTVDNKHWKKDVLGNGKASKGDIKQFAVLKWPGLSGMAQDFCDAACIAWWGVRRFGKNAPLLGE